MSEEDEAAARREARKDWPTKLVRLGEEDDAGDMRAYTIAERLDALHQLSEAAYPMTEHDAEYYSPRHVARVIRRRL